MLLEKLYGTLGRLYRTSHRFFNAVRMRSMKVFHQLAKSGYLLYTWRSFYELFSVLHILAERLVHGPVLDLVVFALHHAAQLGAGA
jgi:hypothetical protein